MIKYRYTILCVRVYNMDIGMYLRMISKQNIDYLQYNII